MARPDFPDPIKYICDEAASSTHLDTFMHYRESKGTPIERIFQTALWSCVKFILRAEYDELLVFDPKWETYGGPHNFSPPKEWTSTIVVYPQCPIENYRADFLIWAYYCGGVQLSEDNEPIYDAHLWRRFVIECDGHNYHERTKEQAAKDRARDREMLMLGYPVFRFTGSELWRDPIKCATEVLDWIRK